MKRFLSKFLLLFVLLSVPALSSHASAYESAWFPASTMDITQLPYENVSHGSCNALDFLPHGRVFAPFTGVIKQIDRTWGFVLLQSVDKVYYADGSLDYMTVGFLHDENIRTLKVGQIISQGTAFYDEGGQGQLSDGSYGHYCDNHVDMSIYRGKVDFTPRYGAGNISAYKAMFINPKKTTKIICKGVKASGSKMMGNAPGDWTKLWKNLPVTTEPVPAPDPVPAKQPARTSITHFANDLPGAVSITWKIKSGIRGYEIMIARNPKFTKGVQTIKVRKRTTTEAVLAVQKYKYYYVKIRTYNKSGKSRWSKVKSVFIKS